MKAPPLLAGSDIDEFGCKASIVKLIHLFQLQEASNSI